MLSLCRQAKYALLLFDKIFCKYLQSICKIVCAFISILTLEVISIKKIISVLIALCLTIPTCLFSFSVLAENAEESISLPILMYHHISAVPTCCGDYTVSPETLEGDLAYLRDHGYTSISLAELRAYGNGEGSLPDKPIMITFDDGQESFLRYGLPLFEKYDMCAVLAIIGRSADIYTETEDHNIRYSYFSWPALAKLSASPHVELAAHTYNMHKMEQRRGCKIMRGESPEHYTAEFGRDLSLTESRFQSYIGELPYAFAYPYGFYCNEAKNMLQERGYCILFTCNQKVNHLHGLPDELLKLGRFNRPNDADRERFFQKLSS